MNAALIASFPYYLLNIFDLPGNCGKLQHPALVKFALLEFLELQNQATCLEPHLVPHHLTPYKEHLRAIGVKVTISIILRVHTFNFNLQELSALDIISKYLTNRNWFKERDHAWYIKLYKFLASLQDSATIRRTLKYLL